MKLRTSFFNPTALRQDILRFAPAWVLYLLGGLLFLHSYLGTAYLVAYGAESNAVLEAFEVSIHLMAVPNLLYALLCALLLFGDLFRARLCNALHAMPLRREGWLLTHGTAGLLFSLVPNLIFALSMMPRLGFAWHLAFPWFLAVMLQYVFFFGVATLCAMLSGSRFGSAAVYGLINFLSLLVFWFLQTLYLPRLPGLRLLEEPFLPFCPVAQLCSDRYVFFSSLLTPTGGIRFAPGSGWGYLCILALLGICAVALSAVLYRRRNLERAGDIIVFRHMAPVFCVVYTLAFGAVLHWFSGILFGVERYIFLIVGLLVGYFTAQMLLRRTVKVFRPKPLLHGGVLCVLLLASIALTALDPAGLTRMVPQQGQVVSAALVPDHYLVDLPSNTFSTDPEEIRQILELHETIVEHRRDSGKAALSVQLCYQLEDGSTLNRYYDVPFGSEAFPALKRWFSQPRNVFGVETLQRLLDETMLVEVSLYSTDIKEPVSTLQGNSPEAQQLLRAAWADCEEGAICSLSAIRRYEGENELGYLTLHFSNGNRIVLWDIFFSENCQHILDCLSQLAGAAS